MTGVGAAAEVGDDDIIGAGLALQPLVQPDVTMVVPQLLQPVETEEQPLVQAGALQLGAQQEGAGAAQQRAAR